MSGRDTNQSPVSNNVEAQLLSPPKVDNYYLTLVIPRGAVLVQVGACLLTDNSVVAQVCLYYMVSDKEAGDEPA